MMFFEICICLKYYFQEFGLNISPLTLKVTLNHKHNTIKKLTSHNSMKIAYYQLIDTKRASYGSSCTEITPPLDNINLTLPQLDASITNHTPLSTSTPGKEGVKTPTSNVTGRQAKLMESSPDMCKETTQELEDLL